MSNITTIPALSGENNLSRYLTEIRQFPMLSADQEFAYARAWRDNEDVEAAHAMVTSHLRLVAKLAMGYRGYGLPTSELISEGNVGLMQAVKSSTPKRLSTGHLRHVVDQGVDPGIYPAQLVAGKNGHDSGTEEIVFQPAEVEEQNADA